jgi:light-regulated signal transduction histidine kinase (bacteriophytochrome)
MFENARLFNCWSRMSLSYRGAAIVTIPALCLLAALGTWLWSRTEGLAIRTSIESSQERIANIKDLLIVITLIATNFTLNSRNQELAEFAYAAAHDLKTPLRGISTLSEWIEEEVSPYSSAQLDLHIRLLRQRTHRLNTSIDGLWEYTNLGQTPVEPEPVELATFFPEIEADFVLPPNFTIEIQQTDLHLLTCNRHSALHKIHA